ncbi:MAG: radical SAM protein [Desulfuromonadaceae bacterium]|nr:radical SAM protein [Desulfuromonadaceae bacterium]MDD2854900.1 radical SAM protein [Desulfuromonadaceae bacterium]
MKILLTYQSGLSHRKDPYISLLPTGLCYLHACLRDAGHDSLLTNFSACSTNHIKQLLNDFKPQMIGISQWTHNRYASLELARLCRTILPDCTIIMGGAHATFCYDEILTIDSPVDIVVIGEAEATLLELVSLLESGAAWQQINGIAFLDGESIVTTSPRKRLENIDLLPMPAEHLLYSAGLDIQLQTEFIVTTRGCPSSCYFCSSPDFWGRKVRFRSPEAIVKEILYIQETFGLIYFSIRDDTFTADRKRVIDFCRLLRDQRVNIIWNCQSRVTAIDEELVVEMKRAGCECIQLGVESGSTRILTQLGKNISPAEINNASRIINEAGINLSIYLIGNIPGETLDDVNHTLELIRKIRPDDGYVSPLAYYPGTKLYKDALSKGLTTKTLFSATRHNALYAASPKERSAQLILKELSENRPKNPKRFTDQKKRIGECFTTNVIAGEWYRQQGALNKAEKEFKEITVNTPDNPWGWFLLGDLYSEIGNPERAAGCYSKVLRIIPEHEPSKKALELCRNKKSRGR